MYNVSIRYYVWEKIFILFYRQTAQNELYAHGVLEHKNIVRNYSSWVEDGYVYIQNEYCNRGNLESYMKKCVVVGNKAKKLMYDIASALRWVFFITLRKLFCLF